MSNRIAPEKLEEVAAVFNQGTDIVTTDKLLAALEAAIRADWHEEDCQAWINDASPTEIADRIAWFYDWPWCRQGNRVKDEETARKHLVDAYRSVRVAVRYAGDVETIAKMNEVTSLLLKLIHAYRFGAGDALTHVRGQLSRQTREAVDRELGERLAEMDHREGR